MIANPAAPGDKIDKHGALDAEPFAYQVTKDARVLIYWQAKLIKTVAGGEAQKLMGVLADANAQEAQLALAKATGNFKRANERGAAEKSKNKSRL